MKEQLQFSRLLLLLLFLFSSVLQVRANGIVLTTRDLQEKSVTLKMTDATINEILSEIKKQTNLNFIYKDAELKSFGKKTISLSNVSVEKALNEILSDKNLSYKIEGNSISIFKKSAPAVQDNTKPVKIEGKVLDGKTKKPITGATVILKNSPNGAITDDAGKFTLNCKIGQEIEVSFVGMKPLTLKISKASADMIIEMENDALNVEDVVVTGIYTRKSDSFTGSAVSFKAKDLKAVGGSNVLQSLKSLDPSFTITENNNYGSDPNRMPDIEIRGKSSVVGLKEEYATDPNQPLFILDGFETTLKTVVDLNMDRVASVTILKDAASTAIYGSKAANGVVVIETKKPEPGKFRVSYNGNFTVNMPDLSDYNLMNSTEKLIFEKEAGRYTAYSQYDQKLLDSLYNKNLAEVARGVDTYWLNEPTRASFTHKHNVYAEGGDDAIRYGLGLTYNNTQGVMKNSGNDLLGINFDLTYRVGKFQFSNKLSVDYLTTENPTVKFNEYANANPYYRKRNADGGVERYLESYLSANGTPYTVENPLYNASLNSFDNSKSLEIKENFNVEWKIIPTIIARGRFGLGKTILKNDKFLSPMHTSFDNTKYDAKGRYTAGTDDTFFYDGDMTVSYGELINDVHQLNAVIGARFREDQYITEANTSIGYPIGDFSRPSFATGYGTGKPSYRTSAVRSASFYFNGGYSYKNRYLLDANFRLDGTSVFGSNKRFTETWAVGLAWNIHNEPFLKDVKWISRLKVRASMGNPGNQNFDAFQSYTTYSFNNWIQNPFGGSMTVTGFGNADLEWQKTIDKNIGADISFLDNRLNINFDVYNKKTDPLLAEVNVPSSVGNKVVLTNMGTQTTKGFDGTIKYSVIFRPQEQINWTLSLNFKHQKSEYQNIGNRLDKFNEENRNKNLVRYYDGGSPTSLWSVRSHGINPADGREVFIKRDGSYTFEYSADDEVIVGNTEPDYSGVFGSTLYYKGFSFTLYLRYSLGADLFNRSLYEKVENISEESLKLNQDKRALNDRWRQTGDVAKFKKISMTETTPMSSRFVSSENYIKGESISVGYDLKPEWLEKSCFSAVRIQANMNDFFRISTVKEERGLEYPFARTISMSVSVTF